VDGDRGLIRVREAVAADAVWWDEALPSVSRPPTGLWAWRAVLRKAYAARPVYFVAERHGVPVATMAAYRPLGGGRRLYSARYGLAAVDQAAAVALVDAMRDRAKQDRLGEVLLSCGYHDHRLGSPGMAETVVLDVLGDEEATWDALRDKTRNLVRKAQRAGLHAEWGWHNLDAFYAVYARHLSAKQFRVHRRRFLREMAVQLGDASDLLILRHEGKVVAGTVVLYGRSVALYPYQAADQACLEMAPNQLMIWEIVRSCVARGIPLLDMGESTPGGATQRFKINFGGRVQPLYSVALGPGHVTKERTAAAGNTPSQGKAYPTALRRPAAVLRQIRSGRVL